MPDPARQILYVLILQHIFIETADC